MEVKKPYYYVNQTSSVEKAEPGENWLVYSGSTNLQRCENAMLLYSGDILLLQTVRKVSREVLNLMDFEDWSSEDYEKWDRIFGKGTESNELRTAYRDFRRVNDQI